ncbi:MAG TPA: tetratricopeptide repeat protein [Thermoanaerobaculia bacterium]|nr:tetratricopeptide repeat protein [Thermoanaerobaculia bacterium]
MKKKLCLSGALIVSILLLTSCQQVQARMAIREGNDSYSKEDYRAALGYYTRAREIDPKGFPDLDRMIGYSRIGLYKPEDQSPQNEQNATLAVTELRKYLRQRPNDHIAREALINLYLNSNRTTDAINFFKEYLQRNPADIEAVRSIATLYAKQGDFNESLNWYEKITLLDSKNPEAFYIFGVVCWEKVAKNPPADMAERLAIIEKGRAALNRAMNLRTDYLEAIAYQNLLYRQQALIEIDPVIQQELIAKADDLRNQAMEINKKRKAAAAAQKAG